jgi:hypothetical protein
MYDIKTSAHGDDVSINVAKRLLLKQESLESYLINEVLLMKLLSNILQETH